HETVWAMAAFLAGRHADMGAELAAWLRRQLASPPTTEGPRDTVIALWAKLARSPDLQPLFAEGLGSEGWEAPRLVLAALTQSDLDQLPAGSAEALAQRLPEAPPQVAAEAVAMLRRRAAAAAKEASLAPALLALAARDKLPPTLGLEALACLPTGAATLPDALFERVTAPLLAEAEHADRLRAVDTLARLKLSPSQWRGVAKLLPQAGPLEAGRLLTLFKGQADPDLGRLLIEQVGLASAFDSLRPEDVKAALSGFPEEVRREAVPLEQRQQAARGQQQEKLLAVLQRLQGLEGDIRRGQKVFHGAKTACIVCHAMGYLGGTAGPDLTRIGGVRAEQDLLESILFPSQSFVRNYEPVVIETKAGKAFGGNVRMEGPDFVLLQTGPREEVRLTREEIAETRAGTVSLMPSGLDQQLTDQDLADLLAFLKSSK
ncbi:MAG: dehydrogenase, partial [Planctomycetaceae bacterium]